MWADGSQIDSLNEQITATLGGLIQAEGQITTLEEGGGEPSLVAKAEVTLGVVQ